MTFSLVSVDVKHPVHNSIFSIIPKSVGQSTSFLYWVSLFAYFCNEEKKICAHSSANSIFLENLDFKVS